MSEINTPTMEPVVRESGTPTAPVSKTLFWGGWLLSALPVLMLLMSGLMKLVKPAPIVEGFTHLGWDENLALVLGILELVCTVIYVLPRTAVLGAILLTGYLGGAIATHVRIGEPFYGPLVLGVLVWGGLYLREARLRALLPLRSSHVRSYLAATRVSAGLPFESRLQVGEMLASEHFRKPNKEEGMSEIRSS